MLRCRAGLSRCIRAREFPPLQTLRLRNEGLSTRVAAQERSASTFAHDAPPRENASNARFTPRTDGTQPRRRDAWERSPAGRDLARREDRALRRPVNREEMREEVASGDMWLGKRDPRVTQAEWDRRKRELQYLRDPLEVASFVKQELAKGKAKEMLQLVRMASHSMQVVVSWNHIIDHFMKKSMMTGGNEGMKLHNVNEAMKTFNEMKKRGQFPDSYTYTIVLRGLANNADQNGVTSKAIAVYHSMSAPNARVKPTIIHTNAALTVCARSLDMDALWGFAAKIPESGPGAADARTFTIILNAIRQSLLVGAPLGEGENELAHRRERGVMEGRRIWEDVVGKWRNADLVVEEELVCAMGRLLLVGSRPRDWDDVLSLVEQTMDIPRLVPRLGSIARQALPPTVRAPNTPSDLRFDDDHLSPDKTSARGDEFLALAEGKDGKDPKPLTYAKPLNDTLNMVLEACQKIIAPKAADEYWDMLTDTYGIVPDNNNLHQRLRLLRQNRASTAVVKMLQDDFWKLHFKPGTFRLAMSTCVRDKNNHNSLRNAHELLALMMKKLPDADAKTASRYAELAVSFPLATGQDLVDSLTYLQPVVKSLRIQLNVGTEETSRRRFGAELAGEAKEDAVAALRKIYAVYDRLLLSNLIPEEQKPPFKAERARMSAQLSRLSGRSAAKSEAGGNKDEGEGGEGSGEAGRRAERRGGEGPRGTWRSSRVRPAAQRRPWSSPAPRHEREAA